MVFGQDIVQDRENVFFNFFGVVCIVDDDLFFCEVDDGKIVLMGIVYFWVGVEVWCIENVLFWFKVFKFSFGGVQEYIVGKLIVLWIFVYQVQVYVVVIICVNVGIVYEYIFVCEVVDDFVFELLKVLVVNRFVDVVLIDYIFCFGVFYDEMVLRRVAGEFIGFYSDSVQISQEVLFVLDCFLYECFWVQILVGIFDLFDVQCF